MKKEILLGLTILGLSQLAFSRQQRREIGKKTNWTCEAPGCRKSFGKGWLVEINHKKPLGEGGKDVVSNGEVLCLDDHRKFHERRGDSGAVRLIQSRIARTDGGHTYKWLFKKRS